MRLYKLQKQFANASNTFNWISIISKGITLWLSYNNTTCCLEQVQSTMDSRMEPGMKAMVNAHLHLIQPSAKAGYWCNLATRTMLLAQRATPLQ